MTMDLLAAQAPDLARWVGVLAPARQLAEVIADTDFVPRAMRGKPDVVTAAIMYGDELGLGPMQALAGMDVVEGKPRPSAELARALILRAGHTFVVHDATGTRVRVSGLRAGRPESERVTVEWTADMARAAGLLNRPNWRSYPRAMLMARATSDLARILFPDVIKGLSYIAEDEGSARTLDEWAPQPVAPEVPVAPPANVRQIQRRTRPAPGTMIGSESTREPTDASGPVTPAGSGAREAPPEAPPTASEDAPAPDLPPETPPGPDPESGPEPVTGAQRRAIFAATSRLLGPDADDREMRLALCAAILERPVATSNELTRAEAFTVLEWVHRIAAGTANWSYDRDRQVAQVWPVRHEPADGDPDPPEDFPNAPADPWSDLGGGSS